MSLRLSDTAISAIAQLVQVGMLTGTDIVDNLRTLRLESDGEFLNLIPGSHHKTCFDLDVQARIRGQEKFPLIDYLIDLEAAEKQFDLILRKLFQ